MKHEIESWRAHPWDDQAAIYMCACGFETTLRFHPHFDVQYGEEA